MAMRRRPLRRFLRRRKKLVRAAAGTAGLAVIGWGVSYGMPRLIDAFQDESARG